MERVIYLALGENGSIRLDYEKGGRQFIESFENLHVGVLHTSFNSNGEVLNQNLLKPTKNTVSFAEEFASGLNSSTIKSDYKEIRLKKSCPNCGKESLKRDLERNSGGIPIMPMYKCDSCSARSYHLTDDYLEKLVHSNRILFDKKEAKMLDADSDAFVKEIREYIIRIFASKKVMSIR